MKLEVKAEKKKWNENEKKMLIFKLRMIGFFLGSSMYLFGVDCQKRLN